MAKKVTLTEEFTEEQTTNQLLENETDLLEGLLEAADYLNNEEKTVEIARNGKVLYRFTLHPLTEEETADIRKKHTKFTLNKATGMRVQEELDSVKFRSALIYYSTIEEDRKRIWDNKELHKALSKKGHVIINALDVINVLLLPAERSKVIKVLDTLGGYDDLTSAKIVDDNAVNTIKN